MYLLMPDLRRGVLAATIAGVAVLTASAHGVARDAAQSGLHRIWINGREISLHRARNPTLSPDGRRLAFFRDGSVYVASTDGSPPSRWSSRLRGIQGFELAWSPSSDGIAVATDNPFIGDAGLGRIYLVERTEQQLIARVAGSVVGLGWSPDGTLLTYDHADSATDWWVTAVTPSGHRVWRTRGMTLVSPAWSPRGYVKVLLRRGPAGRPVVRIYGSGGKFMSAFPGRVAVWSPRGDRIAVLVADRLEVRSPTGHVLFTRRFPGLIRPQAPDVEPKEGNGLRWSDDHHVLISWTNGLGAGAFERAVAVDLRHGTISPASRISFLGLLSPNRRLVADLAHRYGRNGSPIAIGLRVSRSDGGRIRMLVPFRRCANFHGSYLVWFPDGRSLIYSFAC
jgi:hypothetical protein